MKKTILLVLILISIGVNAQRKSTGYYYNNSNKFSKPKAEVVIGSTMLIATFVTVSTYANTTRQTMDFNNPGMMMQNNRKRDLIAGTMIVATISSYFATKWLREKLDKPYNKRGKFI